MNAKRSFLTIGFLVLLSVALASSLHAQAWQSRFGLTPSQLQTTFNDLTKQGYRLKSINGYTSGGAELYTALWAKESGPEWYAKDDQTQAEFQKTFDDYVKQGFRLTWISGYEVNGTVKYAGIFEKSSGPAWEAINDATADDFQKKFDGFVKQGYRLTHIDGYTSGGSARFAGIFEKSSGPAWEALNNMTASDFQKKFNDYLAKGYRLTDMSGYNVGGTDYYAAIWEKSSGPIWQARDGIAESFYQDEFDNFYYQGYRQTLVTAFASGSGAKINGIWENTNFKEADLQTIDTQMKKYMDTYQVPGAAIAITKDGRLVYAAGFGYANKETGEPASPTSLFRIASVSKQFTSAAIMKLVEAGKIKLSDKVFGPGSILGSEYPTPAGNQKINQITVKYLLEHVSGLTDSPDDPMFDNLSYDHKQLITWVLNDPTRKMTRDANTQWEYLNFGYCLLGRVIEKVTGKTYEQYVKEAVLTPSGISDMAIGANTEAAHKPREAKYYPADAYSLNVTRFDSHGGWVASPIDIARFLVHVDGSPTKPDIISAESYKETMTAAHIKDNKGNDPGYGFGWFVSPQWHNGCMEGTIAWEEVLPNGYGYTFVANTRPANDGCAGNFSNAVQGIIGSVSAWPSYDLF